MRSRKLLALIFSLLAIAPALAGYMTLLGAGVGSIQLVASWVSTTDPTFPSSSLTYSGPSLSTMFDSTGKLTYKPNNLLTYSNTFSNAAWTKSNVTVSSGVADPFGGTNAFTLTATSAGGYLQQIITTTPSTNVLTSFWIRRRTGSGNVRLNATVSNPIQAVTGTWTQFYTTQPSNGSGLAWNGILFDTGGDAVDVYVATTSAVTYETTPRTGDQVITTSAAYYGPRIDYDPNTLAVKGLLIEESRTNLALNSNSLSSATWAKASLTLSTDGTLGPDGAAISKITTSSSVTVGQIYAATPLAITSGSPFAQSWIVKKGNLNFVSLLAQVSNGNYACAVFDISGTADISASQTSVGATSGTIISATGKYLGNGLFRLTLVSSMTGATAYPVLQYPSAATGNTFDAGGNLASMAAANSTSYAGYVQHEADSFATSYIPTGASSVTRAADVVQFTGAALTALQGSAGSAIVQTADAANSGSSQALIGSNAISNMYMRLGGITLSSIASDSTTLSASGAYSLTTSARAAVAWGASSRSLVHDGGTVATDAKTFSGASAAYLGAANDGAQYWINGHVASFAIYNQRLPDATLQAKSVVGASYAASDNANPFTPKFAANDNLPVHWRIAL